MKNLPAVLIVLLSACSGYAAEPYRIAVGTNSAIVLPSRPNSAKLPAYVPGTNAAGTYAAISGSVYMALSATTNPPGASAWLAIPPGERTGADVANLSTSTVWYAYDAPAAIGAGIPLHPGERLHLPAWQGEVRAVSTATNATLGVAER